MIQHKKLLDLKISEKIRYLYYFRSAAGWLEDIKGSELRRMTIVKMEEFTEGLCRGLDLHRYRGECTDRHAHHQSAIGIPEWQLPVFLVIIIHHKSIKVMLFDE